MNLTLLDDSRIVWNAEGIVKLRPPLFWRWRETRVPRLGNATRLPSWSTHLLPLLNRWSGLVGWRLNPNRGPSALSVQGLMRRPNFRNRLAAIASSARAHCRTSAARCMGCCFRGHGTLRRSEPRRESANALLERLSEPEDRHCLPGASDRHRCPAHHGDSPGGRRLPDRSELVAAGHGLHSRDRPVHRWALPRSVAKRWRRVVVRQPDHPGNYRGEREDRPVLPVRPFR